MQPGSIERLVPQPPRQRDAINLHGSTGGTNLNAQKLGGEVIGGGALRPEAPSLGFELRALNLDVFRVSSTSKHYGKHRANLDHASFLFIHVLNSKYLGS